MDTDKLATAVLAVLLLTVTIPLSVILYWLKASPILLTVAKSKKDRGRE